MAKIWVLSMCEVQEGGGDVLPAELFATEADGVACIDHYAKTKAYWGCVDYDLREVEMPTQKEELK